MDSMDDLMSVKALRKAKKKEIQAWIAAFEEREGRSPEAKDKEVVRPMYREFKELEARLAGLAATAVPDQDEGENPDGDGLGSATVPNPASLNDREGVGLRVTDAIDGEEDLLELKKERDARKETIKSWVKEFEEREGHPPSTEDKAPIKGLYREFKTLDRRLADALDAEEKAAQNEGAAEAEGVLDGVSSPPMDVDDIKAEKKRIKGDIQEWLDAFEAREGRAAVQEDKAEIRHLYKRHKTLERELVRLASRASLDSSGGAAGPNDADAGSVLTDSPVREEELRGQPSMVVSPILLSPSLSSVAQTPTVLSPGSSTEALTSVEVQEGVTATASRVEEGLEPSGTPTQSDNSAGATDNRVDSVDTTPVPDERPTRGIERTQGGEDATGGSVHDAGVGNLGDELNRTVDDKDEGPRDVESSDHERVNDGGSEEKVRESMYLTPKALVESDRVGHGAEDGARGMTEAASRTMDVDDSKSIEEHDNFKDSEGVVSEGPNFSDDNSLFPIMPGGQPEGATRSSATDEAETSKAYEGHELQTEAGELDTLSVSGAAQSPQDNHPSVNDHPKSMTAQEARVRRMRTRFQNMKGLLDAEEEEGTPSAATATSPASAPDEGARSRWTLLGDAIAPGRLSPPSPIHSLVKRAIAHVAKDKNVNIVPKDSAAPATIATDHEHVAPSAFPADSADVSVAWMSGQLANLLLSDAPPPPPPPPPGLQALEAEATRLRGAVYPPPPGYVAEYQEGVSGVELVVASVGVDEVEARERALEMERLANIREETNIYRAREANLLYREDRARRRILAIKAADDNLMKVEKQATIEISIAKERALAPAFARARGSLEAAIRAQAGRVREVFGELRPGETAGARRFRIDWRGVPQPVEIRLHCIRAVRDRLPRGSYVMLASMAERLGGRVMRWTKEHDFDDGNNDEDSIDTDGCDTRPEASLPVQHGGRYFDRELRLDQNVYQLCPSKADVRPGNVMMFELFRLAGSGSSGSGGGARCGSSRHKGGELDEDTAVGWCVLPLADSRLRLVRGSFRIPLLRGEPNPNIDLHEGLEKLIAADLEAWLGNLYLDVRHLPREARSEGADGKGSLLGGNGFDVEYDHVRKVVRLGKGLWTGLATSKGRWQRWRGNDSGDSNGAVVTGGPDNVDQTGELQGGVDIEQGRGDVELLTDHDASEERNAAALMAGSDKDDTTTEVGDAVENDKPPASEHETEKDASSVSAKKTRWNPFKSKEKTKSVNSTLKTPPAIPPLALGAIGATREAEVNTLEAGDDKTGRGRRRKAAAASRAAANARKLRAKQTSAPGEERVPPDAGGWAISPVVKDDYEDDTHVNQGATLDEECLSDDDLHRGSRFHFTPAGEAADAVDTAAGANTQEGGRVIGTGLRRRGEGSRWDSAALGVGHKGLPRRYGGGNGPTGQDSHVWTPLKDPAEMEYYRFAVASDPGTDAPPTPADIIRHKLRYIRQEVLLDLHPRGWRVVEYWLAVMVFIGALWLRVYLHALGQWFMLYSLGVPVFSFSPRIWEFAIKYMDRSSSLGVEVAFVWWGPTFVTACFLTLACLARLWGMAACGGKGGGGGEGLPESFSRFVAAFGVAAILDPYFLCIVDFMAGNHDCASQCADYTSPTCRCHEGDAWKLFVRLEAEEGAGISGALLTVMIYCMVSIVTALILHQYLLHAHMNGRMLDVWRRLNANEDNFFVPHDLEVSSAELHHACLRARTWRGPGGTRREVILHDFHVAEDEAASSPEDGASGGNNASSNNNKRAAFMLRRSPRTKATSSVFPAREERKNKDIAKITHVAIYELTVDGRKALHRQFLRTSDGTILEVFGEAGREVGWQLRSSLNALMKEEVRAGGSGEADITEKGIFAGMLPAEAPAVSENIAEGSMAG